MRKRKGQIEQSSGNVFADLGLVDPEARLARAELARRIGDLIAERATASSARAHGLDTLEVGSEQPRLITAHPV